MEITIGVAIGSSIQISVGVVPLLVLVGWAIGRDLTLYFENFETICLFLSVLLVNLVVNDGLSNYLEGIMLVALYLGKSFGDMPCPDHCTWNFQADALTISNCGRLLGAIVRPWGNIQHMPPVYATLRR